MSESKRLAFFLPNTFTAINLACGFFSIILSFKGQYYEAAMALVLGSIFDSVDGRVARITGTESQFGEQFDSMSDVVSFGIAPSILVYNRFLVDMGRAGIVVAFVFLLCGALRLARFNSNIEKVSSDFFQGLPIPSAALGLIGLVLFSLEFSFIKDVAIISPVYIIFFAILMISNIPFYSFKNSHAARKYKKAMLVFIFLTLILTATYEELMIGVVILFYVISSVIYYLLNLNRFRGIFDWQNESEHSD